MAWGIAQARQNLSEVVRLAAEEPQPICNRGRLVLVTRNARDFEDCGVALLNPFSGAQPFAG